MTDTKTGEDTPPDTTHPAGPAPDEVPLPRPSDDELPAVLEALLFAATAPLTVKRLVALTGGVEAELVEAALGDLRDAMERRASGLMLMEVAGGYQMATRAEVADWVLALHKHRRRNPISPALMETLAIVAYKQPIVRSEIEAIRGVDCGGVLRSLQDAGLVEVVGQREIPGRPSLYGTTETFLKTFGLRRLDDLPSLDELKRILTARMKGAEEEDDDDGGEPAETDAPPPGETRREPTEEERDLLRRAEEAVADETPPADGGST